MKILLVALNAKYIHSNPAIYALKAYAGDYRDSVELAEYTINNQADMILQDIYKKKPDVLMFSCYIWNLSMIEEVSREFHKLCPLVPIWLGGPEVSYEVEAFLKEHPQVKGVMMGEGEETFTELCAYYTGNPAEDALKEVKGIAYREARDEANINVNPWREILPLSKVPFYYDSADDFSNRIIYYESSRGCPFSCSYCLSSVDKKLRFRDMDLVKNELQFFIDRKVPQVKFVDRTFNCLHEHAMAIWKYIHEHDNGVTNFHFEISADLLKEEELEFMSEMRPGLIQLEIGVQSANEVTIREIHRSMSLERVKEVVRQVKSYGNIHQHLDLIAGLPYEDYDTFRKSFDEIYALQPNQLQMGFLKVLKGSYMYEHAKEYGILYHDRPPYEVMATKWLGYDEVLRMKQIEEMLEVYYNSGQFELSIKLLGLLYDSAFDMYEEMGRYYEEKKLYSMSHSRIRRCEILLNFVQEKLAGQEEDKADYTELFREALVFDIYYRENSKSRPPFAKDVNQLKTMTHHYCKNGKMCHVELFCHDVLGILYGDWDLKQLKKHCEDKTAKYWVLYSYDRRDPLSHQAMAEYVQEV